VRIEAVAERFEFGPQLGVVVDFTIENQRDVTVITVHGLLPVLQVDDLEPYRT
jgi:hypothetical protein